MVLLAIDELVKSFPNLPAKSWAAVFTMTGAEMAVAGGFSDKSFAALAMMLAGNARERQRARDAAKGPS